VFSQFFGFAPSLAQANLSSSPATCSSHSKSQLRSTIHDRVEWNRILHCMAVWFQRSRCWSWGSV